ncbi:MAG: 50S ribosomal protein L11 methyltransferase [Eubacterium sp.]|nr:50S ribosomal protein L11 methyltransferase [Eubacterium sp.]
MKWIKFTINTHNDAVDLLSYMLDEAGIEGIEVDDNIPLTEEEKSQMFVDILPDPVDNDGTAKVNFYIEPQDCNKEEILKKVNDILSEISAYTNIGAGTIDVSETEDKDWMNNWKTFFKPFRASSNIIVKPSWEDADEVSDYNSESDIVIEIDPGMAFGTGTHETTMLCIKALSQVKCSDKQVLDVGCGTGILAIAAAKLGAGHVIATDIDPDATKVAAENLDKNSVPREKFEVYTGDLINGEATDHSYTFKAPVADENISDKVRADNDIVIANILADVIIPLSAIVPKHLKKGGIFISSGILDTKADEVENALVANGFEIIDKHELNEWVCFVAKRL